MGVKHITSEGKAIEPFSIHFDVPGHEIPLSTYVTTAEQTKAVIASFNRAIFDGKLQYEIVVLPPEDGTFLSRLALVVIAASGVAWAFAESDIGKAFFRGLTTHEPSYWAELAGAHIRERLADIEDVNDAQVETEADKNSECKYSATLLVEATKAFLQKDAAELVQVGITPGKFRDAYEARNRFYQACSENTDIRAIGFDESPHFPVPRTDFVRLQIALPPEEEEDDDPWLTAIAALKVTSPNWDREDRQRQWKGKDSHGRERYFRIDDEHFWSLVAADQLNTHIIDVIKVQWAFQGKVEAPKHCRVLRVLEFNSVALSTPLDDNALSALLGSFEEVPVDQPDLFRDP